MHTFLTLFILGIGGYLVFETARAYLTADGTRWQRIVATFRNSASIAWARINALSSFAVGALVYATDALGQPGVKDALEPYLAPKFMLAYVLVVLVGAEIARRRTL